MTDTTTTEGAQSQVEYTRWLMQLRADMAETISGELVRGARPVPVGSTPGATMRPTTSSGALVGYAIRNLSSSEGATVLVLFRDGGPDGDVILPLALAPGESARDWFGPGGIHLGSGGLYMDINGTVDGSVYLRGAQ